jgi:hypothetical protein
MFEDLGITLISDKCKSTSVYLSDVDRTFSRLTFPFVIDRPKTFFAPTNAAFEALPAGVLDALLASQDEIGKLINTHTASGPYYSR